MKPLLSFSTWNLLRGVAAYLNVNLHRFVVGGRESTAVMGSYSLASDIAAMPSTALLAPLGRVLFPMFVELRDDLAKLKRAVPRARDPRWSAFRQAWADGRRERDRTALLGESGCRRYLHADYRSSTSFRDRRQRQFMLALGRAKVSALGAWASVLLFAILATVVFRAGAYEIATLRLAVGAFGLVTFFFLVKRELRTLRLREVLASIWRPCVASVAMALVIVALPFDTWPAMAQLLIKVSLGATVYVVAMLALWRLAGCPEGGESYLLEKSDDRAVRYLMRQPPKL
jgi:O-antigen/teichoic acid export membrane protein